MLRIFRVVLPCLFLGGICGCENPVADAAKATVDEAKPIIVAEPAAPAPSADTAVRETLPITPETCTIEFVGSKVTGSHDGGFKDFEGMLTLYPNEPAKSRLVVEIDMDSTWSDSKKLTGHLKSKDFFHFENFPTATFKTTEIAPAEGLDGSHRVTGNLTLHGVTKSISFPASFNVSDESVTLNSEFAINRKDFGIVYPGSPDNLIRDHVLIRIALDAPRDGVSNSPDHSSAGKAQGKSPGEA